MGYQSVLFEADPKLFYIPAAALFVCITALFLWCQIWGKRDNSWIDSFWGITFIIPNIIIWIMRYDQITIRMVIITVPVIIWGLRLSSYIFIRHKGEDWRYEKERKKCEAKGECYYFSVSYFYIFVGQWAASLSTNSSALFVNIYSVRMTGDSGVYFTDFLGLALWIIGFYIEVDSDMRLKNHIANP